MKFKEVKLSELGEIVGGATPSTKNEENYGGNIVWITPKDLTSLSGRYINKGERNLTQKGYSSTSTKLLPINSVLFSSRAPIGYVAINNKKEVCTNQGFKSIVPNSTTDYMFLYYLLKYKKNYIDSLGSGTTFKEVSGNVMKNIIVKVPENLKDQLKISNILSKIDDKIELNNQTNDNLSEFIRNLFENEFINTSNTNWNEDKLGNYLQVERGFSYKGKYLAENGTPMINLGNIMPKGVFRIEKNKFYNGEYKEKFIVKPGDILLANTDMTQNREVIGTPVIIPPLFKSEVIFSHHIYSLRDLRLPKMYVYHLLLTNDWNNVAGNNATGTTVLALPKDVIENYNILIPDNESLLRFEKIAEKIQEKKDLILLENIKLEQLRNTLLPKLMNGEIDLDKIEI